MLIMEQNIDFILCDMGVSEKYVRVSPGHLFKHVDLQTGAANRWGGPLYRPPSGRGGQNTLAGSRSMRSRRPGPMVGEENPDDERVAQRQAREQFHNDIPVEDYMK